MHDNTTPAALTENLAHMGLGDLLTGYIAPERVRRWNYTAVAAFAAAHGFEFERESGNIYGRLMLVPIVLRPVPPLRIITRSDHAAVHPSRPRRAA